MPSLNEELDVLRRLDRDALHARYVAETGREPRQRNVTWLRQRLGWKAQERKLGGLSATARAVLERGVGEIDLPVAPRVVVGKVAKTASARALAVGTTLTREWRGQQVVVQVTDAGFEHAGVIYKSLTAVAKRVTGAHWNGKLFFGVTTRSKKA